ncbi:MAG TPA: transcriptional repressor LexA [Abditibacterium sp.]
MTVCAEKATELGVPAMLTRELTQRQADVMEVLGTCAREGQAPVVAEIAERLGLKGINSISEHLQELGRKGYVRVEGGTRGRQRQIILTEKGQWQVGLRLGVLGSIPAGLPSEVLPQEFEEVEDSLGGFLAQQMGSRQGDFFLRVTGNSMIGDGICDGDYVLLRPTTEVQNGQIAALAVGDERFATLKRVFFLPDPEWLELRPSNPTMEPFQVRASEVRITGIYRGLMRLDE